MDQTEFSKKFKDSAIKRTKLLGLKRNACIALGNNGDIASIPALSNALKVEESLIRIHAAWALRGGERLEAVAAARELAGSTDGWRRRRIGCQSTG